MTFNQRVYAYIRRHFPEVYDKAERKVEEILEQPTLRDRSLLNKIYKDLCDQSEVPLIENRTFAIGVIIQIFDPIWLESECRLPNNLRVDIGTTLGFVNETMVNYYSSQLRSYYKNPRYKERIHQTAAELIEKYQ